MPRLLCTGRLRIKDGNVWLERWFELEPCKLKYYRHQRGQNENDAPEAIIDITNARVQGTEDQNLHRFEVTAEEVTYELEADSAEERGLWVEALKQAIGPRRSSGIAMIVGGVIGAIGAVALAPVALTVVGFTSGGIAAGSMAASMMSSAAIANGGGVAAGSLVALLQSAGAAGLGTAATGAVATVGGAAGAAVVGVGQKIV
ncbi:uncharacterized protein LOC106166212 isoform X2 [Lingula anatina]|uniref:Uncharacterized protein LOC106166212 isoform X2 n=1 Tax=Lingula anatina TaxID=7574 RepID=A0A1S3IPK7_LINAN|nr:uncharacterized protein LOC106166212 isoform X2 [Lingula anatina]|eukprot:XP_013400147.1 uncharacterized protein LOC106166212 isoform X2 [Lingula anatina]